MINNDHTIVQLPIQDGISLEMSLALHAAITEGGCDDRLHEMLSPFLAYARVIFSQERCSPRALPYGQAKANAVYSASLAAHRGVVRALWDDVASGRMSEDMLAYHARSAQEQVATAAYAYRYNG